jgi:penicillin-binding protein 1B
MYNTLANGGFRAPLRAVRAVLGEDGTPLKAPQLEVSEAVSPEAIYALDRMLTEVMERGTGRVAKNQLPEGLVVAGKTGTSNDYRDSWFAGFSGAHLIVSWVGHDDNSPTGLTGTTGGLAVWTRLMSTIPTSSFEPLQPEAVDLRWIDYFSGQETSPYCNGSAVSMPFAPGTLLQSSETCPPGTDPSLLEELLGIGPDDGTDAPPVGQEAAPAHSEIP